VVTSNVRTAINVPLLPLVPMDHGRIGDPHPESPWAPFARWYRADSGEPLARFGER
jgi:hypothetical protein